MKKKGGVMYFPQSVRIAIFILIFIVLLAVCVSLFRMVQQSAEAGMRVYGVYEASWAKYTQEMKRITNAYIEDFSQIDILNGF